MNADGTMSRLPELLAFGEQHRIRVCTVADIIKHRMRHERVVVAEGSGEIVVDGLGAWRTTLYRSIGAEGLHLALTKGTLTSDTTPVRVQAAPPTWSFLGAASTPLAQTARSAMEQIAREGHGALVLMHLSPTHEVLQRTFLRDVVGQAAEAVQLRADALRDLGTGCQILVDLGLRDLALLTSSARPIVGIEAYGLRVVEERPLSSPSKAG